MAMKIAH